MLIAGKGHETGQEIHGEIHPFDDRVVAREAVAGWPPMITMTLAEIAEVVGGTAHGDATVTGGAFIDTRTPEPGGLFVAIAGEHVDGHDFAEQAVAAGAVAVLGSRPTERADGRRRRRGGRARCAWRDTCTTR